MGVVPEPENVDTTCNTGVTGLLQQDTIMDSYPNFTGIFGDMKVPPEIREMIWSHLSISELKKMRLVNSFFCEETSPVFYEKGVRRLNLLQHHQYQQEEEEEDAEEYCRFSIDILDFLEDHEDLVVPSCTSYAKGLRVKCTNEAHQLLFLSQLLEKCSLTLERLELIITVFPEEVEDDRGFLPNLTKTLPRLTFLMVEFHEDHIEPFSTSTYPSEEISNFMRNTPNLASFTCDGHSMSREILKVLRRDEGLWPSLHSLSVLACCPCSEREFTLADIPLFLVERKGRTLRNLSLCGLSVWRIQMILQSLRDGGHHRTLRRLEMSVERSIAPKGGDKQGKTLVTSPLPELRELSISFKRRMPLSSSDFLGLKGLLKDPELLKKKMPFLHTLEVQFPEGKFSQRMCEAIFPETGSNNTNNKTSISIPQIRRLIINYPKVEEVGAPLYKTWMLRFFRLFPNVRRITEMCQAGQETILPADV